MTRKVSLVLILLLLFLSAACSPVKAPAPIAQAVAVTTDTPVTFSLLLPSPTFAATATYTPTPFSTSTPTLPAPSPTTDCMKLGGRMEISKLATKILADGLDYRVYLPPCYDQDLSRSYPVLYLIHGQSYTDDQWDRLGADEGMDAQVPAGKLPPFLIVMPRDRVWSQPEDDPFGEAVIQDLIPYIDSHYRTLANREHRAIGGLSRGGGWAVHLGLGYSDLFGAIGAHGLAVFATDAKRIRQWLDATPHSQIPRIYLDIGNNDRPEIVRSATWLESLLNQKSIPHEWHVFIGYHDEKYWSAHLPGYLAWYSAGW